ncbi:MAG: alpha/beta hydrolase [Thermodesulfobacteriota bacterium]
MTEDEEWNMLSEEIRGRKIYYEIHGTGPVVLLLHHGFASMKMWKDVYPRFVEAGYQVLMYDRRGYGRSEPGEDFDRFYLSDSFCSESVRDLEALTYKLGIRRFNIVGQCEGGVIGTLYAGKFSEQVSSLVIASTLCFSTRTMTEFNAEKFPKSFHELDNGIRDKLLYWHGENRAETLYELARTHGGAYGTGNFDLRPKLPAVQCPALVLYPDRSALFGVEQAVEFYRHLPNAELSVLPRCGHNTYEQLPDEYVRQVLNFLDRSNADTSAKQVDFSMTCLASAPVEQ